MNICSLITATAFIKQKFTRQILESQHFLDFFIGFFIATDHILHDAATEIFKNYSSKILRHSTKYGLVLIADMYATHLLIRNRFKQTVLKRYTNSISPNFIRKKKKKTTNRNSIGLQMCESSSNLSQPSVLLKSFKKRVCCIL